MENCNSYNNYEEEYGAQLENKSLVNKQVCEVCEHKDVCYMYKNICEGRKWYQDYFGADVSCPYFKSVFKVETNIYDKETIIEDCTVQILENTVTGEQSIGWFKNDNPPLQIGEVNE